MEVSYQSKHISGLTTQRDCGQRCPVVSVLATVVHRGKIMINDIAFGLASAATVVILVV